MRSREVTVTDAVAEVAIEAVENDASAAADAPPDQAQTPVVLGDRVAVVELLQLAQPLLAPQLRRPFGEVVQGGQRGWWRQSFERRLECRGRLGRRRRFR